ncbi:putative DNA (cytosine-5-)-methyltransferase [Helianthus annuus]|nr:putative DNA (cytosine-5-)-methyltransferase [Helianthus annuus]
MSSNTVEVNGTESDVAFQASEGNFSYKVDESRVPVPELNISVINGESVTTEVNGTESGVAFQASEGNFSYKVDESPVPVPELNISVINGESVTTEVNGTESDALPVAFDALEGNFSYKVDESPVPVPELNISVINGESVTTEVNGTESDALPVAFDALEGNFSYKVDESPVPVPELNIGVINGETVTTEVNGTESDALPVAFDALEGNFSYKVDESPVPVPELNIGVINGETVTTEVNGTESDALPVAFDALEGNFSYKVDEVSVPVPIPVPESNSRVINSELVTAVEVNGTEYNAQPVSFEALEGNSSYKVDELPELNSSVINGESVTMVEVNGTESDVLPVAFDALEGNFSYKVDEVPLPVPIPVSESNSSVINSELVTTVEVNGAEYNAQSVAFEALEEINGIESDALPVAFDALEGNFSYKVDEVPVPIPVPESKSSVINSELVTTVEVNGTEYNAQPVAFEALEGNFSYKVDELPVPELNSSVINGESVTMVEVNGTESDALEVTMVEVEVNGTESNALDESPGLVSELNGSVANGELVQTPTTFTMDESFIITTDGTSPKRSLPSSPKSPIVAASDGQQSTEDKSIPETSIQSSPGSSSVKSGNAGRGKLERLTQNGLRRSPRLPPRPQTEGTTTSGSKLKRIKSSVEEIDVQRENGSCKRKALTGSADKKQSKRKKVLMFVGEPVPEHEAKERWGWRYELKNKRRKGQSGIINAGEEDEVHVNVECHYLQADVNGCIFSLGDCAHIKGEGMQPHVGRIVEFFKTSDDENYFRVQWFFRAEDTVMKKAAAFHDTKRLFSSTLMNDNLLECILSKVNVIEKTPMLGFQSTSIQPSEYYCDMEYSVKYSTFCSLVTATDSSATPSSLDTNNMTVTTTPLDVSGEIHKTELALLDLYAGCGGMSTGLCLGAKLSGVKLVTRWAIDYHKSACDSLKLNHPETEVRHTTAEDFLELLKEWEQLCKTYILDDPTDRMNETSCDGEDESKIDESSLSDTDMAPGEYEVSSIVDICYGDPSETGQHGLKFKVRWKGYDPSDDTWEPIEALSDCQGHIQTFVRNGFKSKILPCPGDADVICGGPPCQGISGYNRFRNVDDPLNDEKNQQIVVFFDIVKFLNPKYVLMENVGDLLRFDKASLGRYAISRLVHMNYQSRLGIMAAGSYGLPQFRLRVFLWGAHPNERLPQFPLPTHEVIVRYFPPAEFEQNTVAYNEGQPRKLQEAIVLRDAISDLPPVTSHEVREEITYEMPPETEFQKYIRLPKDEMTGSAPKGATDWKNSVLTDHRPYKVSEDDYHRLCHVPRRKGANFRDFPGIIVGDDNMVRRGPADKQVLLPSGRPLIPDYVFTFEKGKSKRPFARLWWDENVATVVTFPNLHSQAAIHPEQDRVLTLREYARLQGFPDHYRFCGNIKERYCQVGNAVAVSVSKTLGYALGMAFRKLSGGEALMTLPPDFAFQVPPLDQL